MPAITPASPISNHLPAGSEHGGWQKLAVKLGFSRLDGYLLGQLLGLFFLSVGVFTLVAFFTDAFLDFLRDIQRYGIPIGIALIMAALQLPSALALAMPAGTFVATLLTFNNLNQKFELVALRASGISLNRLLLPVLALGLVATCADLLLVNQVIPAANQWANQLKTRVLEQGILPSGQEAFILANYSEAHRLDKLLFVGAVENNQLKDTTYVDLSDPRVLHVLQAGSGQAHLSTSNNSPQWVFTNANAYIMVRPTATPPALKASTPAVTPVTANLLAPSQKPAADKQPGLVSNHVGKLVKNNLFGPSAEAESIKNKVHLHALGFGPLQEKIAQLLQAGQPVEPKYYVRLWEKLTLPFSCLAIVLAAVPLAMAPPRQGNERGFVFAVGVLFGFYLVRSLLIGLAQGGALTLGGWVPLPISILVAAWLPVALMAGLGIILLQRKNRML